MLRAILSEEALDGLLGQTQVPKLRIDPAFFEKVALRNEHGRQRSLSPDSCPLPFALETVSEVAKLVHKTLGSNETTRLHRTAFRASGVAVLTTPKGTSQRTPFFGSLFGNFTC